MLKNIYLLVLVIFATITANATPLDLVTGPFDSGQIFTPCNFDGLEQDCFIDTGSPWSFIEKNEFSLSYPSVGQVDSGGASGTTVTCDLIEITDFYVSSDFQMDNFVVRRCPSEDTSMDDSIISESLLGLNVLREKVIHFDFVSNSLNAVASIPSVLTRHKTQNEVRGHISIEMKNSNQDVYGIWDTGAGLTSVDEDFVKANPQHFTFIQDIIGGDGSGVQIPMKLYKAHEIEIGGIKFSNEYVIAFDFAPIRPYFNKNVQFVIGYNIITKANWYFDFNNNDWSVYED